MRAERPATIDQSISDAEWSVRLDLAAAYRMVARNGWDDLIYTHISARVPDRHDQFLLNPFGLGFDEVTASNLVKIDHEGTIVGRSDYPINRAGFIIHSAVHMARPELACVVHLHTETGMALSSLPCGLLPLSQHAMMFYKRIGYHGYESFANDLDERERLVRDLGPHSALILSNHGFLTAGKTIAEAYIRMFFLEKAARAQLIAMAATPTPLIPPEEVCEKTAVMHNNIPDLGARDWAALKRRLDGEDRSYRQ